MLLFSLFNFRKSQLPYFLQILEICGINVMNLSFDEVTSIMDRTGDVIDMIVETQGVQWVVQSFVYRYVYYKFL